MRPAGRRRIQTGLAELLMVGFVGLALAARPAYADGAWLDDASVTWNNPGMAMPSPPPWRGFVDPRCTDQTRSPETDEDQVVQGAGWTLVGSYESGWGVKVVRGLVGYDGMCRPMEYQAFVFVDGTLAGTLSPTPMDSRRDGALQDSHVDHFDTEEIVATFVRYTGVEPFCCPSARSTVTYKIDRSGPVPVLARENTTTYRPGAP
jgi:hypothetical protein